MMTQSKLANTPAAAPTTDGTAATCYFDESEISASKSTKTAPEES